MAGNDRLTSLIPAAFRVCRTFSLERRNRWKVIGIVSFFLVMLVYSIMRSTFLEASDLRNGYLHPTRAILYKGKDIYANFPNNSFPAFFYCVIAFFAQFTDGVAAALWYCLNVAAYAATIAITAGILRASRPSFRRTPVLLAGLLTGVILADNLFLGQSNILTLLFIALSLFYYVNGRDVRSGVWLSLGICFKVTPALFLLFFALKGRWKALLGAAAGLALFLLVVPSLYFGPVKSIHYARAWSDMILLPYLKGDQVKSVNITWKGGNQSLDAFLHRHLSDYAANKYRGLHRYLHVNLAEPAIRRTGVTIKVALIALLSAITLMLRKRGLASLPYEASLFFFGMLWLSPISWTSHYMLILFPYLVLVHEAANLPAGDARRRLLYGALWTGVGFSVFSLVPSWQSYSGLFIGNAIIFAALAIRAIQFSRPAAERYLPTVATPP